MHQVESGGVNEVGPHFLSDVFEDCYQEIPCSLENSNINVKKEIFELSYVCILEEVTIGKMANLKEIRLYRKRNPQLTVPNFTFFCLISMAL